MCRRTRGLAAVFSISSRMANERMSTACRHTRPNNEEKKKAQTDEVRSWRRRQRQTLTSSSVTSSLTSGFQTIDGRFSGRKLHRRRNRHRMRKRGRC